MRRGIPVCLIARQGFVMREDLASSSFLAVIVVSLGVVCAALIALWL
jgi:hypothetical protein